MRNSVILLKTPILKSFIVHYFLKSNGDEVSGVHKSVLLLPSAGHKGEIHGKILGVLVMEGNVKVRIFSCRTMTLV